MAPGSGVVASAVILPESQAPPPSKRRQSSLSDSVSKRPRYSDASSRSPTAIRDSPQPIEESKDVPSDTRKRPIDDRRKSSMQEEKKRGQRLFGGLLSTLSQSTPNGQQKRRQEVEKRQQEKAKQQKADDDIRKKEKLANLKKVREAEQVKFNEAAMRTRHTNLLAMARCLNTKTTPKLYYKPWDMLPEQEARIKQQIDDAKATIERETSAFYIRYPTARRSPILEKKIPEDQTNAESEEKSGEPQDVPVTQSLSTSDVDVDITNPSVQALVAEPEVAVKAEIDLVKNEQVPTDEHNGEVVVENEEDTVIY